MATSRRTSPTGLGLPSSVLLSHDRGKPLSRSLWHSSWNFTERGLPRLEPTTRNEETARNRVQLHPEKSCSPGTVHGLKSGLLTHYSDYMPLLPKWVSVSLHIREYSWRDGLAVQITYCSSREPEFNSWRPLWVAVTLGDLTPETHALVYINTQR